MTSLACSRDITTIHDCLAACRREGRTPFFLPPGPCDWHTKPSCAPHGGRNGANNRCSGPHFCSLRQTARLENFTTSNGGTVSASSLPIDLDSNRRSLSACFLRREESYRW